MVSADFSYILAWGSAWLVFDGWLSLGPTIARSRFTFLGRARSGGDADNARGAGERDGDQPLDGEQSVGGERSREGRNASQCEATPACGDKRVGDGEGGEGDSGGHGDTTAVRRGDGEGM